MATNGSTPADLEAYKCDCEDHESAIGPSAYLADLIDYVTTDGPGSGHVNDSNGALSIEDLQNTFYQPFSELSATTEAAQETVRHVRICNEVLLRYLEDGGGSESESTFTIGEESATATGTGIPDQSEIRAYRLAAYEALLDEWGLSREDLRTAAYNEDERGWVADTIGIPENMVADLWLDPDAPLDRRYDLWSRGPLTSVFETTDETIPPSEGNLEDLFGLPALTKSSDNGRVPTDPLRTVEEPFLRIWRTEYLQDTWTEQDHPTDEYPSHLHENTPYTYQQIDDESTRPIVDPDLIGPDDFRVIPDMTFSRESAFPSDDEAFTLWETRRKWLDGELESIWKKLPVPAETPGELSLVEVQADPARRGGASDLDLNDEYVIFENIGGEPLDLTGYRIENDRGDSYSFADSFTLDPGARLTLYTGSNGSNSSSSSEFYWGRSQSDSPVWHKSGDTVHVFDDQGTEVLSTTYSGSSYVNDGITTVLNTMLDTVSYSGQAGDQVWYSGHQGTPSKVTVKPSSGSQGDGPLASRGFLKDFDLLYRQLSGGTDTATQAREDRKNSQYPTGDVADSPAEAARSVIEAELHLSERAFRRLVELLRKYYTEDEQVSDEEWWEVTSIIGGARKRSLFDVWITEEEGKKDVHLDRKTFWQSQREPQQGEWSFRLDRHDPIDPDEEAGPYIDPERMNRSELPEQPRGATAHKLYENRQETLQNQRQSFIETFEEYRRELQSKFESLRKKHDETLATLTTRSPIPDEKSTIDDILADQYGSVSWSNVPESGWEARFSWLHEGLQLAKKQNQSGSNLSNADQQQIKNVRAKLEELRLSDDEFRQLHRLREQAKLTGPNDEGLSPEEIAELFAVLPLGAPLDDVLTETHKSKANNPELRSIYADTETPPRWDPLFDEITEKLEESSASNAGQQSSAPPELDALGLSSEEFESVLSLRRRARPGPDGASPSEALVSEVIRILTSVWKRNEHYPTGGSSSGGSTWLDQENKRGLDNYWDARKARLPAWRATAEDRDQWHQALYQRSSAPIVDPDLIEGVDDFEPPAWKKDGFDLWKDRKNFLLGSNGTALVKEVEQLRTDAQQGNYNLDPSDADDARTEIDTALERTVGVELNELRTIADRMAQGDDVGIRLARLDLTTSALSYVLEIDDNLGTQPIRVEEWESLKNILLRAWKQRQYGRWNREERAFGVVLEPQQFDLPDPDEDRGAPDEDDPLRWRVNWSIRDQWEDILESRNDQLETVDEEIEAAVAAAEKEALPVLRETLIDRATTGDSALTDEEKTEWLSERLLIDTEMYGGRETTRTSQAITSLQDLLQSLDLHLDDEDSGLAEAEVSLDDDEFDQRWQWLGTYDKWKAAMGVYLYPENALLPTLRQRTTEKFDRIARRLSRNRDLTASRVYEEAQKYRDYLRDVMALEPVAGCMAPRVSSNTGSDRALAYVFAGSMRSDTYYFKAFDPVWKDHQHSNSTWTAIPITELDSIDRIVGVATYDGSIYLFVTVPSSSGTEGGNDSNSDGSGKGSSSSRLTEINYVRYDIRDDHWHKPEKVEIPKKVDGKKLGAIEKVDTVVMEGWDQSPELVVDFFGTERIFVRFDDNGTPPSKDDYYGSDIYSSPDDRTNSIVTLAIDETTRIVFQFSDFSVYDLDPSSTYKTHQDYTSAGLPFGAFANVVYRPLAPGGDAILIPWLSDKEISMVDINPRSPHFKTHNTVDRTSWHKNARSNVMSRPGSDDTDVVPMFQCNNITAIPREVGFLQLWQQKNAVLIGSGTPRWSTGTQTGTEARVPMTMKASISIKSGSGTDATYAFTGKYNKELVPAVDKAATKSTNNSWLFGPRLENTDLDYLSPLSDHSENAKGILEETIVPNRVYVAEAYYQLPLFIARQLTQAGEYEEALRWFRTVYDFTAGSGSDDRAVWPELEPDPPGGRSEPSTDWLLDPINPHAIAETRSNAYTKFTLFSIIRCLSEYGDDEFTQDTPKTVSNATDLYEQALDLLETDILHREEDPCRREIRRLNTYILIHVLEPEIWTNEPGLSREDVEAKTDELVRVVEGIDDYTDRRQAVSEIGDHLDSGDLNKALDVANKWEERERDEPTFKERLVTVVSFLTQISSEPTSIESALVNVAKTMRNRSGGSTGSSSRSSRATMVSEIPNAELLNAATGRGFSENNIDATGLFGSSGPIGTATASPEETDIFERNPERESVSVSSESSGETASGSGETSTNADLEFATADPEFSLEPVEPERSESSATVDAATMDIIEATKHQFCIPKNPLLTSLRRHAEVNLEKIRSGRNIAGMKRELDPYASPVSIESAAPTPAGGGAIGASQGDVRPTNYRYETLVERAKELAKQAQQFEAELLTAIEKAEREEYKLKKARQQVELAQERVSLQETRLERAQGKVELARLRREKARIRRTTYQDWLDNPLVQAEQQAMSTLRSAMLLQNIAAGLHLAAGYYHGVAAGVAGIQKKPMQLASSMAATFSSAAAAASTRAGALSTRAQIEQIRARKQRRQRRWTLKKRIAQQNYEIGTQRIDIAKDTVDIVRQEREIAELRADHAEDIVNFHENKFTNEELYQWIADVLEGVYRYFLQQAASVAKMAQRQLAFKRQGLPRTFIKTDYWEAPTQGQTAVPAAQDRQQDTADRRGMTGSARLLQDIYELDQHEFRTDERRLQVEKIVSVAELDPMALQQFRETGVLSFATTLEDFDIDHPGHYHRMIEDVDVTIVALTPPTEGINATLRNSGTSRIVVGDTLFQEQTIDRDPETVVLNRARSAEAENEIRFKPQQREMLRPFEHSGVATDWELEMPRAANDMDYSTIVDVQLTIEYSALESYDYRQRVISELDPERTVERSYSFHDDFGDAWYELNNAPGNAASTTVTFDTERDDFPSNLFDLTLDSAQLYFVVSGPNRADDRKDLEDLKVEFGPADGSGKTSKATNGTIDFGSLDTDSLDQEWELTVTFPTGDDSSPNMDGPSPNRYDPFADGTIEDVLLIVTADGEAPNWPP